MINYVNNVGRIRGHSVVVCSFLGFGHHRYHCFFFVKSSYHELRVDFIEVRKFCFVVDCLLVGGLIFTLQIQRRNRKIEITEGKKHK